MAGWLDGWMAGRETGGAIQFRRMTTLSEEVWAMGIMMFAGTIVYCKLLLNKWIFFWSISIKSITWR
jgi:hypothetical protein